jgi:lantibiotic modifying enzyme
VTTTEPALPDVDRLDALVDGLVADAIWHDGRCTWTGDEPQADRSLVHRTLGGDLYGGTAGIGWALAHRAAAVDADVIADTAVGAFAHAARWAALGADAGLHTGTAGVAVAAASAAAAWRRAGRDASALTAVADETTARLLAGLGSARAWDLIGGDAGTVLGLLALARLLDRPDLVVAATAVGDRLVASATAAVPIGMAWPPTPEPGKPAGPPLCGVAHGGSGAAVALHALAAATDVARYDEVALAAAAYERSWFDAGERSWPDLRDLADLDPAGDGRPVHPMFWCHGTVGIGIARIAAHARTGDLGALAEAAAAIDTATTTVLRALATETVAADVSLCHGVGGIVELHLAADAAHPDPRHREVAARLAAAAWSRQDPERPVGGVHGGESPALMTGTAGTVAWLHRVHDPASFPPPLDVTAW